MPPSSPCPTCGEPVQPDWRICPVCETRLKALTCPACGLAVKENWKRCPQCEVPLVCPVCGSRVTGPDGVCPRCRAAAAAPDRTDTRALSPGSENPVSKLPATFTDAVCGIEMVRVPGGSFAMGDTFGAGADNEQPVHEVALDGFYMAIWCVTQAQWLRLMPDNPAMFEGQRHPVEQVTWGAARDFARRLTESHKGQYRFDLPTEAQWEYGARSGGRETLYAGEEEIDRLAWYEANSHGHTHDVGTKTPNGLGLCDMSGNVWEWCRDGFADDAYRQHAARNPLMETTEADRVIRGGAYHLDAWSARCARRLGFARDLMGPGLGFRLVMTPAVGNAR